MESKIKLIIVGGSLATGKSTISKYISEKTGIARVSLDEIKEVLFDVGGYRDRAWSKEIGRAAFTVFCQLIEMYLQRGESVIADATFLWESDRIWLEEFVLKYNAELIQIWLTADPMISRARFIDRANTTRHPGHCDSLETVMDEFDTRFFSKLHSPLVVEARTHIIDTTDFLNVDFQAILNFLNL